MSTQATQIASQLASQCPTSKKSFQTEQEAMAWEARNRETYNLQPQYAYKCEDCPNWHLTAMAPGQRNMARTNYSALVLRAPAKGRPPRDLSQDRKDEANELFVQGVSRREIAEKLGVSYGAVCSYLKIGSGQDLAKKIPFDLETIVQQEEELKTRLERLEVQKQSILETKKLKVMPCWEGTGFLIAKDNERMALKLEDCKELAEKLLDLLTK